VELEYALGVHWWGALRVRQSGKQARRGLKASSTLLRAPRFIERSVTVAAVLASLGIVIVGVGVFVGEVGGTVIASIGTIFVTVALFSVLYDGFLKDILLDEIYRALGIEQNLRAIDLREILRKDQLDLGS
jgi:hypothetical protein